MGLMPQDAYYYFYGQHLSLSYFDHPGMIGYLLRFFTDIFGQAVFVIKLTDFLITSATIYCFYVLGSYFLSRQKLLRASLLLVSTVFISVLSFNSTPDVPLLLFWSLSLLCLYKAVFEEKKTFWLLAGIAMGLAFNSKYTAILLQFGLLAFLVFSSEYRKLLRTPWVWICLLISLAVTFPVWWWNFKHDFASFAFQSSDRTSSISKFQITPKFFLGALLHQSFLLLPILFWLCLVFTFKYIKRAIIQFKIPKAKVLFLLAFFIPTFVGFFALTPVYWVKLNWMLPSYITGIILAGMFVTKKQLKIQLIMAIAIHVALSLQIFFYWVPIKSDDTWVGWKELAGETKKLKKSYPDSFIFSNDSYKTTAALNFYLEDEERIYAQNIIGLQALHYDYIEDDLSDLKGKNAIFIDSDKRFKNSDKRGDVHPAVLSEYFETVTEIDPIIIKKNGKKVRKFWVFYCTRYTPN